MAKQSKFKKHDEDEKESSNSLSKNDERYQLNYDDSSDDESQELLSYAEVIKNYDNHKSQAGTPFEKILKEGLTSFTHYYMGLSLLYSQHVQQPYLRLKQKYLSGTTLPDEIVIKKWIAQSITKSIYYQLEIENKAYISTSKQVASFLMEKITEPIERFIEICLQDKRGLIKSIRSNKKLPKVIADALKSIKSEALLYAQNIHTHFGFDETSFPPKYSVTPENLLEYSKIRAKLAVEFEDVIDQIETIHNKVVENSFGDGLSLLSPSKDFISSATKAETACDKILCRKDLTDIQKEYIKNIKRLERHIVPKVLKDDFIDGLYKKHLKKIIEDENDRKNSILQGGKLVFNADIDGSYFKEYKGYLRNFTHWGKGRIKKYFVDQIESFDIEEEVTSRLKANFPMLEQHTLRETLSSSFNFYSSSYLEYMANIRLNNCSAARTIKNQSEPSLLGSTKEELHIRTWNLSISRKYSANERQRLTKHTRTDYVLIHTQETKYTDIFNNIEQIKESLVESIDRGSVIMKFYHIDDSNIALWIREVYNGKIPSYLNNNFEIPLGPKQKNDITFFLVNITHLIFGTECSRYPGSFISHQMVLDLIIAKKQTFKEAFSETKDKTIMPMSLPKMTSVSGYLSSIFNKYILHHYDYRSSKSDVEICELQEFAKAEHRLAQKWTDFILERDKIGKDTNYQTLVSTEMRKWYAGL